MRFENLIFDLDGTLVDSLDGIEASTRHALQQCLPGRDSRGLREQIGPPVAIMFRRMYPDLEPERLESLVAAFRQHYDAEGCLLSRLYPQVNETLAALARAGSTMFVVTNKPLHATRMILQENSILSCFAEVVSPDSVAPDFTSKTHAVKAVQLRHQLDPGKTAVVGDGIDDQVAASACGFTFILARYGYGNAALGGTAESVLGIANFSELLLLPRK